MRFLRAADISAAHRVNDVRARLCLHRWLALLYRTGSRQPSGVAIGRPGEFAVSLRCACALAALARPPARCAPSCQAYRGLRPDIPDAVRRPVLLHRLHCRRQPARMATRLHRALDVHRLRPRARPLPLSPCPAPCRTPGTGAWERACAATGREGEDSRREGGRERGEKGEVDRDTGDGLPCGRVAGLDEHKRLRRILPQLAARAVWALRGCCPGGPAGGIRASRACCPPRHLAAGPGLSRSLPLLGWLYVVGASGG